MLPDWFVVQEFSSIAVHSSYEICFKYPNIQFWQYSRYKTDELICEILNTNSERLDLCYYIE